MADVAAQSQPREIAASGLGVQPPDNISLSKSVQTSRSGHLVLDTLSPVTQNGSFEFDRIIRSGQVLKRTRKTKSWKPIFIVLRPNLLSLYRNKDETKLRHQISLSELTAVARQKDPKRREKHIFALFSSSRNYHLEAESDKEAQEWVELIRREAHIDEGEEEMYLASPSGGQSAFHGFERNPDAQIGPSNDDRGGYSSSDVEVPSSAPHRLPKQRDRGMSNVSGARRASHVEYSGPDHGSYSDFSDSVGGPAARMSALSLTHPDAGRPSTSSTQPQPAHSVYDQAPTTRHGPGVRNTSQMSGLALFQEKAAQAPQDDERVIYHGWIFLLKSNRGVRQWKKFWMVLRPKALALYANEEEYSVKLLVSFSTIIDVVEIDPISKSKTACMQVISEERSYRFCALDEESLARWLGAFKSLLRKRKAKEASTQVQATTVAV